MIRQSINLPARYRLDLKVIKRRDLSVDDPFLPPIAKIRRVRAGNKFSRFFRHIFEHNKFKRFLGSNLAVLAFASTLLPAYNGSFDVDQFEPGAPQTITQTLTLQTEHGVQHPLETEKVNQGYNVFHPGVDFDGDTGDPVRPVMAGIVISVQKYHAGISSLIHSSDYGNAVLVQHGDDLQSLYAHLSKIFVREGDEVNLTTTIGEVGTTGRSSGDHLHLEIRDRGYPINPFSILPRK